jgi:hypothetical protein
MLLLDTGFKLNYLITKWIFLIFKIFIFDLYHYLRYCKQLKMY